MIQMCMEILAFIFTTSGWILVSSTLPTDYWKVATLDGVVISTNVQFSNLWKIYVTDFIGSSDCKDFPSMLALDGGHHLNWEFQCVTSTAWESSISIWEHELHPLKAINQRSNLQVCRALMITAICLGFFGSSFALIGMKCTKIRGSDRTKARIVCVAGVTFMFGGLCSMSACSLYAHKITTEFFDPTFVEIKFDFGVALFIGWSGSFLSIVGGSMLCFSNAGCFAKCNGQDKYIYRGAHSRSQTPLSLESSQRL